MLQVSKWETGSATKLAAKRSVGVVPQVTASCTGE